MELYMKHEYYNNFSGGLNFAAFYIPHKRKVLLAEQEYRRPEAADKRTTLSLTEVRSSGIELTLHSNDERSNQSQC